MPITTAHWTPAPTLTPHGEPVQYKSRTNVHFLVRPGTHLVAVGADSPGKQELPSQLFARAAHILTDDHAQCLDHGDFGNAVRAGSIQKDADQMLGHLLSQCVEQMRNPEDIIIVDLTGIAAEDIAIAELFSGMLKA